MKISSRTWGTQENAIAFIRGTSGRVIRHKTLPIVGLVRAGGSAESPASYALWIGNACRPSAYYSARNEAQAVRELEHVWKRAEERLAAKAARRREQADARATLKAAHFFTVGDVLVNSWGYEQTNVDFYQVTHVGARTIKIREIAKKVGTDGFMSGKCQPDRFNFTGEEMLKPVNAYGRISFKHGGCSTWGGKAVRWSAYH